VQGGSQGHDCTLRFSADRSPHRRSYVPAGVYGTQSPPSSRYSLTVSESKATSTLTRSPLATTLAARTGTTSAGSAVPHYAREAARARKRASVFHCALVDDAFPGTEIQMTFRGALTVTAQPLGNDGSAKAWEQGGRPWEAPEYTFSVPARTLTSVLNEAGVGDIDFLFLDVEGFEGQVLRGLDLNRYPPRIVLVEARTDDRRQRAIAEALGGRYEEIMRPTPLDILYRYVG
jgi:FkbM family methyltransferase